jgi:predicted Rossmann fold nucleotide-binding protein DprA/Smf involved in DNA uptake
VRNHIVEGAQYSGSLIAAHLAMASGREVFSVPLFAASLTGSGQEI